MGTHLAQTSYRDPYNPTITDEEISPKRGSNVPRVTQQSGSWALVLRWFSSAAHRPRALASCPWVLPWLFLPRVPLASDSVSPSGR